MVLTALAVTVKLAPAGSVDSGTSAPLNVTTQLPVASATAGLAVPCHTTVTAALASEMPPMATLAASTALTRSSVATTPIARGKEPVLTVTDAWAGTALLPAMSRATAVIENWPSAGISSLEKLALHWLAASTGTILVD